MKKCSYKKEYLVRYLQNRISRKEESELQKHLLICNECIKELASLRSTVRELETPKKNTKKLVIAAAIACSLAGGVCLYQSYQTPGETAFPPKKFEYNEQPNYQQVDTLSNDSALITPNDEEFIHP